LNYLHHNLGGLWEPSPHQQYIYSVYNTLHSIFTNATKGKGKKRKEKKRKGKKEKDVGKAFYQMGVVLPFSLKEVEPSFAQNGSQQVLLDVPKTIFNLYPLDDLEIPL